MSKKLQVQEDVSPNLIPMIDIMFLLLLFFMLGADMGQRELEEVILPKALAVKEEKEVKGESQSDRVVVNIYHRYAEDVPCEAYKNGQICRERDHWRIGIKGHDFTDINNKKGREDRNLEKMLMREGDRSRAAPMGKLSSGQQVATSERPVMIRADASAPYGFVQEVVNACAKVGIYKIECSAARPADADKLERSAPAAKG